MLMVAAPDAEWMKGYEDGRTHCLTRGLEVARGRIFGETTRAYESGWSWALFDYEDANGLPHRREQGA